MSLFNNYLLPETTAYLARCTTQPSAKWTNALNTLIRQMIIDGHWQLFDGLWIFATPTGCQTNAKINIVNPTSTLITEVNSPTWTANQGYNGNGTSSYLNLNYNPSSGTNFTSNSNSFGTYSRTNITTGNTYDLGCYDGTNFSVLSNCVAGTGGSTMAGYNNINTGADYEEGSVSTSLSLGANVRSASATVKLYQSGSALTLVHGGSYTATGVPSANMYALCYNSNGTPTQFSSRQLAMAFAGSGNINQSKFYSAFQAFATTIGFYV